jgi:hypothetical protein
VTPLAVKDILSKPSKGFLAIACWAVDDAVSMKAVVASNVRSINWQKQSVKQIR